ncbi:hypothetical protein NBRC3299_1186 [Acetobacter pasteurianus NBRC 3299]|nr:hypothetical protein NBRC3299_1186 [Acetobacter pasteurianus NBRC 3299]
MALDVLYYAQEKLFLLSEHPEIFLSDTKTKEMLDMRASA